MGPPHGAGHRLASRAALGGEVRAAEAVSCSRGSVSYVRTTRARLRAPAKTRRSPAPTEVGAGLHCPSWDRTKTRLNQSGRRILLIACNLSQVTRVRAARAGNRSLRCRNLSCLARSNVAVCHARVVDFQDGLLQDSTQLGCCPAPRDCLVRRHRLTSGAPVMRPEGQAGVKQRAPARRCRTAQAASCRSPPAASSRVMRE